MFKVNEGGIDIIGDIVPIQVVHAGSVISGGVVMDPEMFLGTQNRAAQTIQTIADNFPAFPQEFKDGGSAAFDIRIAQCVRTGHWYEAGKTDRKSCRYGKFSDIHASPGKWVCINE
jgi:hypothetical protein